MRSEERDPRPAQRPSPGWIRWSVHSVHSVHYVHAFGLRGDGMPNKVFIHAFGCQMNKLDAELALSALRRAGYEEAATPDEADVVLYNTCSVRAHAEERVYSNVGKLKSLKRRKPRLIIGILGCMAQKDGEKIFERLPHVDLVCGTREFPRIAELIEEARRADRVLACSEDAAVSEAREISVRPNRRRAFLGIMRGCDNYCAYCVVPYVRGPEISRPVAEVVDEAKRLADDGCREITLLGQNVNSYGKSFTPSADALADLLARLDKITGLARVRFVTSHPKDMSREILEAVRDLPTVCEHLHMPAQSGSDRVLAAMNRRYTARGYRDLVALARELVPGIAIASDFIVGFPGETERGIRRDRRARPRPSLPELLRLQVLHAPRHRRREARRRRALGRKAPPQPGASGDSGGDQPRGEPQVHRAGGGSPRRRPQPPRRLAPDRPPADQPDRRFRRARVARRRTRPRPRRVRHGADACRHANAGR